MNRSCPDRAPKKKRTGTLREFWSRVEVKSCADGSMNIKPVWKGVKPYTPEDGGGPGLLSRLAAAKRCEKLLNEYLKVVKRG